MAELPKWRRQPPAPGVSPPRRHVVLGLLLLAGLVGLLMLAALPYLRPPARVTLVPLLVQPDALAWRQKDHAAISEGAYFLATAGPAGRLTQEALLHEAARQEAPALVVYLSSLARINPDGRSCLLPADADATDPATWLPVARFLEALKRSRSRHVLLVLDTTNIDGVEEALAEVPDSRRLVLLACGKGQSPLWSEVMGRSVFGHYFEAGLAGQADANGDGRVSARELAGYLAGRVGRWARRVRGVDQSPVLFGEGDFIVADLPNGQPRPFAPLPEEDEPYPKALKEAWARAAPHQREALAAVERAWRAGHAHDPAAALALPLSPAARRPKPRSLAQAVGGPPPIGLVEAARQAILSTEARTRSLPTDKAGPVRAQAAEAFLKETKPSPALAAAILDVVAADPRPFVVSFARQLLALIEPAAEHVEVLALYRLAALDLPRPVIQQALEVAIGVERVASRLRGFGRIEPLAEAVAGRLHDAFVVLESPGYAPLSRAEALLKQAHAALAAAGARMEANRAELEAIDEADRVLPAAREYIRRTGKDDADWRAAVALMKTPDSPEFRARLAELDVPFTIAGVEARIRAARGGSVAAWRELDGILATGRMDPSRRVAAVEALRDLGRRLEEDNWRLDRQDRRAVIPPPAALEVAGEPAGRLPGVVASEDSTLWAWQAGRYRYEAREAMALSPESAAATFYLRAAAEHRPWLPPEPEAFAEVTEASEFPRLLPGEPARTTLEARAVPAGPLQLEPILPDDEWLSADPERLSLPAKGQRPTASGSFLIMLRLSLKPGAGTGRAPAPAGVLVRAEFNGRSYHRRVTVPLSPRLPEAVLAPVGQEPGPASARLGLRVIPGRQAYQMWLRNPLARTWNKLSVRVFAGGETRESAPFALGPNETRKVEFPAAPPAPPGAAAPLPELASPLRVSVIDNDGKADVLATHPISVGIARPGEIAAVTRASFEPAGGKNRLEVRLRLRGPIAGPDVTAELTLPPPSEGGASYIDGTLRGKLPADGKELVLFADGVTAPESSARFSVGVDGWARGFGFRATLTPRAGSALPAADDAPAIRMRVGPFGVAGPGYAVPLEVDNAPSGANIELALGRLDGGAFREELSARREASHDTRIGFALAGGQLAFEVSRRDWAVPLDTSRVRGVRTLRARLLDAEGRELAQSSRNVTLGDQAPEGVRFVSPPAKAWNKAPLALRATGGDATAGVKEVFFFVGKPVAGKVPDGVLRTPAALVGDSWSAKVPAPAGRTGPTEVTVQFINALGLSAFATEVIEFTDDDPGKTALGSISGRLLEGDRPQGGLEVVLTDEKGVEKGRQKTKDDGAFAFKGLPAGKYRLSATKTSSGRKGSNPRVPGAFIELAPGAEVTADVVLFL